MPTSGTNGDNQVAVAFIGFVSLAEICTIALITAAFHYVRIFVANLAEPAPYVDQSIDYAKYVVLASELFFVLFNLGISILLVLLKNSVRGNEKSFTKFLKEAGGSGICMLITMLFAWLIALSDSSATSGSSNIERLLLFWTLNAAFYIMLAGSVCSMWVAMYNAGKEKLSFFRS